MLGFFAGGCPTAPFDRAGSLQSYDSLVPSDGLLTRSLLKVSKDDVLAAKTVRIIPTRFSEPAALVPFAPAQRSLVSNVVDRTLCAGLSERFAVVSPSEPADLTVQAVVTHAQPTDALAAGLSKGAAVAKTVFLPGVPVPVPRIPIGLGSLSLEAEARGPKGDQKAAMVWGRGANAFLGSGRVAQEGDAYALAAEFGADFSGMLVTGTTPFGTLPTLPSIASLGALFGRASKYPACDAFGKSPGLVGMAAGALSLPPDWTDNGAAARP